MSIAKTCLTFDTKTPFLQCTGDCRGDNLIRIDCYSNARFSVAVIVFDTILHQRCTTDFYGIRGSILQCRGTTIKIYGAKSCNRRRVMCKTRSHKIRSSPGYGVGPTYVLDLHQ